MYNIGDEVYYLDSTLEIIRGTISDGDSKFFHVLWDDGIKNCYSVRFGFSEERFSFSKEDAYKKLAHKIYTHNYIRYHDLEISK